MEGVISNFRRGAHNQTPNQMIIVVPGSVSKESAGKLVGKTVTWTSPAGKQIKGEIKASHGNKGAVRALFETGMPGQSVGQKVVVQ